MSKVVALISQNPRLKEIYEQTMADVERLAEEFDKRSQEGKDKFWSALQAELIKMGVYPEGQDFTDISLSYDGELGVIIEKDKKKNAAEVLSKLAQIIADHVDAEERKENGHV